MNQIKIPVQIDGQNEIYTLISIPVEALTLVTNTGIEHTNENANCTVTTSSITDDNLIHLISEQCANDGTAANKLDSDVELSDNTGQLNLIAENEKNLDSFLLPAERDKNTTTLKCQFCSDTFSIISEFKRHVGIHLTTKKFKCSVCVESYNIENNLKIHEALYHQNVTICPVCNIEFKRAASFKAHVLIHQTDELFVCNVCRAELDKEEEFLRHIVKHEIKDFQSLNKVFTCKYCEYTFKDRNVLREHVANHIKMKKTVMKIKQQNPRKRRYAHKERRFKCEICGKFFSKYCLLIRHIRIHSGERPYVCHICNYAFTQKGTLEIHLIRHSGVKPHQCTLCPAKFAQKGNLRVHVKKTHAAPRAGEHFFKCQFCTCIFKKASSLNGHITKFHHCDKVPNEDDVMQKLQEIEKHLGTFVPSVPDSTDLVSAVGTSKEATNNNNNGDNTRPVVLVDTSVEGVVKRFTVKRRRDADTNYYLCLYCPKEFKKPSDLIRHFRKHTKEKPFKCKLCQQKFSLKSSLNSHLITHSRRRELQCTICLKLFKSVRSLNSHLRKHDRSTVPNYECSLCNKKFFSVARAEYHMQEHIKTDSDLMNTIKNNITEEIQVKEPLISTDKGLLPISNIQKPVSDNKKYKCWMCDTSFNDRLTLQDHFSTHTGSKNLDPTDLRKHTANTEKNFVCQVCERPFASNTLLKRHLGSHTTQKVYVCPYCQKAFRTLQTCKKHIDVHGRNMKFVKPGMVLNLNETPKPPMIDLDTAFSDNPFADYTVQDIATSPSETALTFNDKPMPLIPNPSDLIYSNESGLILPTESLDQGKKDSNPQRENLGNKHNSDVFVNQFQTDFILNTSQDVQDNAMMVSVDTSLLNDSHLDQQMFETLLPTLTLANPNEILPNSHGKSATYCRETIKPTDSTLSDLVYTSTIATDNGLTETFLNSEIEEYQITDHSCNKCGRLLKSAIELHQHSCHKIHETNETKKSSPPKKSGKTQKKFTFKRKLVNVDKRAIDATKVPVQSKLSDKKSNGIESNTCSYCQKYFKKRSDLIRHERVHTGEKPYKCVTCEKSFSLKCTLEMHMKTHNPGGSKTFVCSVCNSYFSSKGSLRVHCFKHTGAKPYACSLCPAKFRTSGHRKSHMIKHQKENNKPKRNEKLVEATWIDSLKLDDGIVQVEPDTLNSAEDSEQAYKTIQLDPLYFQLEDNLYVVLDANNPSTSTKSSYLEDSSKTDTGAIRQVFECDECDKTYSRRAILTKHKKNVHGEQKFKCSKCDKGFVTDEKLQNHLKSHSGFHCHLCSNKFTLEKNLKIHMRRIHSG